MWLLIELYGTKIIRPKTSKNVFSSCCLNLRNQLSSYYVDSVGTPLTFGFMVNSKKVLSLIFVFRLIRKGLSFTIFYISIGAEIESREHLDLPCNALTNSFNTKIVPSRKSSTIVTGELLLGMLSLTFDGRLVDNLRESDRVLLNRIKS